MKSDRLRQRFIHKLIWLTGDGERCEGATRRPLPSLSTLHLHPIKVPLQTGNSKQWSGRCIVNAFLSGKFKQREGLGVLNPAHLDSSCLSSIAKLIQIPVKISFSM